MPLVAYGLAALSLVQAGRGDAAGAMASAREASAIVDLLGGGGPLRMYAPPRSASRRSRPTSTARRSTTCAPPRRLSSGSAGASRRWSSSTPTSSSCSSAPAIARALWSGWRGSTRRRSGPAARGRARSSSGCAGQLAPDDDAPAHFERALELHAQDRQPFVTARTRLAYGQRLRRAGERTASREQLGLAGEVFERLGATRWAERAQEELSRPARRSAAASMPEAEQLTPCELQVALRVAEGLTNREVAAAIFLSPKTVEHHLSAIYRKLGIRSRTELARHIAESEPDTVRLTAARPGLRRPALRGRRAARPPPEPRGRASPIAAVGRVARRTAAG